MWWAGLCPIACELVTTSRYTAPDLVTAGTSHGLRRSMGVTGICWDNAGVESMWSTFKYGYYYRHTFGAKAECIAAVDNWIRSNNHQRR